LSLLRRNEAMRNALIYAALFAVILGQFIEQSARIKEAELLDKRFLQLENQLVYLDNNLVHSYIGSDIKLRVMKSCLKESVR
jgi:hypothetical protein